MGFGYEKIYKERSIYKWKGDRMRSDDKDLLTGLVIAVIGTAILYIFFLHNLGTSLVLKVLYSILALVVIFLVVVAVETKWDFYNI